jgi:uncharacterized protein YbcV (DUF1398 family)
VKSFLSKKSKIFFAEISKKIFLLCCLLILFSNENSLADIVRSTTFDDRLACEKSRGSWRDFGNSCVDKCSYKFDQYAVCAYAITFGCDCGKNRCLHQDKCISINEYKKIDDERILKDKEIVDEIKELRIKRAKKFKNEYLNKLAGIYGADPNYRDPNRNYQEQKELPPNTFKNTNRQLVYNYIVKKRNDKILAKAKAQEEIDLKNKLIEDSNKVAENQQEESDKPKLFKFINELKNDNLTQDNSNKSMENNNNITKNAPIVLKPIEEEPAVVDSPPKNNEESFFRKFTKTPQDIFDEANKILQNQDNKQNVENKNNDMNIPPVYVKQQNGENDFKNGDVINNIEGIPQFTN